MTVAKKIKKRTQARKNRVRRSIREHSELPRISVFRSLRNISAQLIDDEKQHTLVSFSSEKIAQPEGDKKKRAYAVGQEIAKRAQDKGVTKVVFDRGSYRYHGRVKALADGLRAGGLSV